MAIQEVKTMSNTTDRKTRIIKPGQDMDKNAFLKILAAELSNQDPTSPQDSTQYVAQMAQFASLEQMSNLNSSVTFSNASSLVGKAVAMNSVDQNGKPYVGFVRSVYKSFKGIVVTLEMVRDGKTVYGEFPYEMVNEVIDHSIIQKPGDSGDDSNNSDTPIEEVTPTP